MRIITSGICLLSMAFLSAQQTPVRDAVNAATAAGTATLSGTVVTAEATSHPVRRATVTLSGAELYAGGVTVTDDAGRFSFSKLPAGRYSLSGSRPGYISVSYGAKRPGRPGTPIMLDDGQQMINVTLKMLRGAVITGTVRDQRGEPAPGARVSVMRYGFGNQTGEKTLVSAGGGLGEATDDRGVYRIYGLPPGEYVVAVAIGIGISGGSDIRETTPAEVQWATRQLQPSGQIGQAASAPPPEKGQSVDYAPVYYPGTTTQTSATMITLAAGEERSGIDLPLQMIPTAKIVGTVVSPDGPLPAMLQVNMVSHAPSTGLPFAGFSSGAADKDGHFSFPGVAPGRYTITIRAPATPSAGRGAGGPPAPSAAPTVYGLAEIEVGGRDVAVTIPLQQGVTVSGHVAFDGTTLTPPADLTRVRVNMTAVLTAGAALGVPAATVDAEGAFTFSGVTPGRYRFSASVPGSTPTTGWVIRNAMVKGVDTLETPLQVGTDNVDDAVLTFTDRRTELSGSMQDAAGHPAPEYFIVVFPSDQALWTPGSRRIQAVRPAVDGKYRAPNLPPGEYLIAAVTDVEPGEWFDPSFLAQLAPLAIKVTIAEGEKKIQDMRVGG